MEEDPLSKLCVGHLTQILDLNYLEDLKELEEFGYVAQNLDIEEAGGSQVAYIFKTFGKKVMANVFGRPVTEGTVQMVILLIDYLKQYACTEGLFRLSGSKKRQEELKEILLRGGKMELPQDCPFSCHDVAGVLKLFFGDFPEPLLSKQLYDCYQQLAGKIKEMDCVSGREKKVQALQYLFLLLPPLNRLLLKKLLELLSLVAEDESSKMTSYNLGVVFAPNIICDRQPMTRLSELTDTMEPFTELMAFIIDNASEVFKIPSAFMDESKEYLRALAKERDADVPVTRPFCVQKRANEFRRDVKVNTDEALLMLYSQVFDMQDCPKKAEFLEKFQRNYPGTPPFVPKSLRERHPSASCVPVEGRTSVNPYSSLPSLVDNQTKSSDVLPCTPRPERVSAFRSIEEYVRRCSSQETVTPGTPGQRMKKCLKRLRKRSVDSFLPKSMRKSLSSPALSSLTSSQRSELNSIEIPRMPSTDLEDSLNEPDNRHVGPFASLKSKFKGSRSFRFGRQRSGSLCADGNAGASLASTPARASSRSADDLLESDSFEAPAGPVIKPSLFPDLTPVGKSSRVFGRHRSQFLKRKVLPQKTKVVRPSNCCVGSESESEKPPCVSGKKGAAFFRSPSPLKNLTNKSAAIPDTPMLEKFKSTVIFSKETTL